MRIRIDNVVRCSWRDWKVRVFYVSPFFFSRQQSDRNISAICNVNTLSCCNCNSIVSRRLLNNIVSTHFSVVFRFSLVFHSILLLFSSRFVTNLKIPLWPVWSLSLAGVSIIIIIIGGIYIALIPYSPLAVFLKKKIYKPYQKFTVSKNTHLHRDYELKAFWIRVFKVFFLLKDLSITQFAVKRAKSVLHGTHNQYILSPMYLFP